MAVTDAYEAAKVHMREILSRVGKDVLYIFADGSTLPIRCDFREQLSTEERDPRGARIIVRFAVAHVHLDDVPTPSRKDKIEYLGITWNVAEIDPESASHRFDLRHSTRLERSGGRLTEDRV